MNPKEIIANIKLYLGSLHVFDYLAYSWVLIVFLIFIMLAITLRHKVGLSILFILLSFITFFIAPVFVKHLMDGYVRKGVVSVDEIIKFNYAETLVANGEVRNEGKKIFSKCIIEFDVIKNETNFLLKIKEELKPIRHQIVEVEGPLEVGQSKPFEIKISNFTTISDYNTTIKARCY